MTEYEDAMYAAIVSTLEEMAFVLLEIDEIHDLSEDNMLACHIKFTGRSDGAKSGTFHLVLSRSMVPVVAVNMLGPLGITSPTPSDELDALGEMGNVICGNFLPNLVGANAVYDVGHPEPCDPVAAPEGSISAVAVMEDGIARAHIELD